MSKVLIAPRELVNYGITTSEVHRRRLEKIGEFPKRVRVTGRMHAYVHQEILDFLASKIAARDGVKAA
jgi:predicted DNA-binding transcriptional regulator AlpA